MALCVGTGGVTVGIAIGLAVAATKSPGLELVTTSEANDTIMTVSIFASVGAAVSTVPVSCTEIAWPTSAETGS